jgi:hypothetical protein
MKLLDRPSLIASSGRVLPEPTHLLHVLLALLVLCIHCVATSGTTSVVPLHRVPWLLLLPRVHLIWYKVRTSM